jgi:hypothetical protein
MVEEVNMTNNANKYYPLYKITPPERIDQVEDQLVLNIVARNRSSLTGSYYLYVNGLVVDAGMLQEITVNSKVESPMALGRAIVALVEKMRAK